MSKIKWQDAPEEHDYPAAADYLSLVLPDTVVQAVVDGLRAGSVPLVASRSVPAARAFDKVRGFIGEYPIPLAIAVCAIMALAILLWAGLRRIRRGKRVEQK